MSLLTIVLSAAALIAADQLIKLAVLAFLQPVGSVPLIPGIFSLTYVENRGAAFGIFQGNVLFLVVLTSAIIVIGGWVLYKNVFQDRVINRCLLVVMAGGIGNLIDRVCRGFVVDYLHFLPFDFPVFNLADCLVCCGVACMLIYVLFIDRTFIKKEQSS